MKKTLLALLALAPAMPALAEVQAKMVYDVVIGISSDGGRYAVSEMNGSVTVYDLDTNETYPYLETTKSAYGTGNGNYINSNSIVGFVDNTGGSAIWRNGRWTKLPIAAADPAGMGNANGITLDGKRICGNASTGVGMVLEDAVLMVYPCYWDQNENGTYGQQKPLPYPATDFIGQVPQYVRALNVSNDGKTIWGQITSGNGFFEEIIVFKESEDGTWTYETPLRQLLNPDNIEVPPYPGDGPATPSQENYMTEEELSQYDEAMAAYWRNPEGTKMPQYEDYMTQEEIEAYQAALAPVLEWSAKYSVYENAIVSLMDKGITFTMNVLFVSNNGRYVVSAVDRTLYEDSTGASYKQYTPFIYDTVSGEAKEVPYENYSMLPTGVSDNGDLIAYRETKDSYVSYVRKGQTGEWVEFADYIVEREPSLADWVKENWEHEIEDVDELGNPSFATVNCSGIIFPAVDWDSFAGFGIKFWGGENQGQYISSIIRLKASESGIETVEAADNSNAAIEYYDLQGRKVNAPANGIFIKRQGTHSEKISL